MRRLLAEGRSGTYEKAELAAHLLNLNFDESDSVSAAEECSSIYTAIQFLQQDCELCAEKYPMKKVSPGFLYHIDASVTSRVTKASSCCAIITILAMAGRPEAQ